MAPSALNNSSNPLIQAVNQRQKSMLTMQYRTADIKSIYNQSPVSRDSSMKSKNLIIPVRQSIKSRIQTANVRSRYMPPTAKWTNYKQSVDSYP